MFAFACLDYSSVLKMEAVFRPNVGEFVPDYTKSNQKIVLFITVLKGPAISPCPESMLKANNDKFNSQDQNIFNDHYQ
jgi:hypothetical protein